MLEACCIEYILQGHELYWDMLGNMRGMINHKSDVCWLSGDINFTYSVVLNESDILLITSDVKSPQKRN